MTSKDHLQLSLLPQRRAARTRTFRIELSSTLHGAQLARRLTVDQLARCGIGKDTPTSFAVASIIAELAANAVTHGSGDGRDFGLSVVLSRTRVRVEVSDNRPDRLPPTDLQELPPPDHDSMSGRGLLLVDTLADRWGCTVLGPRTKTVWAELDL